MSITRRDFLATTALSSASLALGAEAPQGEKQGGLPAPSGKTVFVGSTNGMKYYEGAAAVLAKEKDTLSAAIHVLRGPEADPDDMSVGYGGLPNEEGEVQLDASVMHGPTRRAGAVAGVRGIKHVANLARLVMERTDHLLLVADGAERFAAAHGFPKENLLTEKSRQTWLLWKEAMSRQDGWGPGLSDPRWTPPVPAATPTTAAPSRREQLEALAREMGINEAWIDIAVSKVLAPPTGTVHCSVLGPGGEMSGATSTSGLAFKLVGRVGDSPIIGAGCFTDQDVGSAGATGRGEECIKMCGAHTIVENMRHGMSPTEACLDALRRIARNYNDDMSRLRYVGMSFYALRRDGAHGAATMWGSGDKPRQYAVYDGTAHLADCPSLFKGEGTYWPPIPKP